MSVSDEAARLKQTWDRWAQTLRKPTCPRCGRRDCSWNGYGERGATVWGDSGPVHVPEFRCRRGKCPACKKSWRIRPPGIIPHKHYQPCVVARAVAQYVGEEDETLEQIARRYDCSRRTVARWVRWVAELADPAVLLSKVVEAVDAPVRSSSLLFTRGLERASTMVRRAIEALALLEDLASAWRLEPPGLRAVLERVVGDRSEVATYARPLIPEFARGPPD